MGTKPTCTLKRASKKKKKPNNTPTPKKAVSMAIHKLIHCNTSLGEILIQSPDTTAPL